MEKESMSKELEKALERFKAKNDEVPQGYFDQFELELMRKIQTQKQGSKQASIFSLFAKQKKYLVAASLLIAIATGYLLYNQPTTNSISTNEMVQIESLPDEVIEAYVNNNELIAEVEWISAIESAGASIPLENN
ncbi:MAG: hypothetical protein ACKOWO_05920 [Sediminibacterium sp.]